MTALFLIHKLTSSQERSDNFALINSWPQLDVTSSIFTLYLLPPHVYNQHFSFDCINFSEWIAIILDHLVTQSASRLRYLVNVVYCSELL